MTILSLENPVILLLENMLEALSTAPDSINNETASPALPAELA
nr:hypothetical protein [Escherichia coli]